MDLSIIIVSHEHDNFLSELIQSISEQIGFSRFEILLLHNLPSDYNSSIPIKTFTNAKPRGLAENLNLLINKAHGPVSLILNPDTKLPNTCLKTCLETLKPNHILSCPSFDTGGKRLVNLRLFPTLKNIFQDRFLDTDSRLKIQSKLELNPNENCWLQGSFLMADTEVFRQIGFDENYELYFEDVDFFRRANMRNISIQYLQKAHHKQVELNLKFDAYILLYASFSFLYNF